MTSLSYKDFFTEQLVSELFKETYPYQLVRSMGDMRKTYGFIAEDGTEYEVVIDKMWLTDLPNELINVLSSFGKIDHTDEKEPYVIDIVFGNLTGPRKIRNYNRRKI